MPAQAAFQRALTEGNGDMRALDSFAACSSKGMTTQLAALSQEPVLAKNAASPTTLLAISWALSKTGNPKAVVRLLETQITLQPPSIDLYAPLPMPARRPATRIAQTRSAPWRRR